MVKQAGFIEAILAGLINLDVIEAVPLLGVNELTPPSSKFYPNRQTDSLLAIASSTFIQKNGNRDPLKKNKSNSNYRLLGGVILEDLSISTNTQAKMY